MTNIAQVINVLQALILTDGASMILTPTYHVYQMFRRHQNATCVRAEPPDGPISVSASKAGNQLLITLVNANLSQDADVELAIRGGKLSRVDATNLTAASVRTQNTLEQPGAASPRLWKARMEASGLILNIPAKSVQAVSVGLT
jgi:alpha-N-arabinofuranosidase